MSMKDRDATLWRQTGWVLYTVLTQMGYLEHSSEDRLSAPDIDRLRGDLRQVQTDRVLDRILEQIEIHILSTKGVLERRHKGGSMIYTEESLKGELRAYEYLKKDMLSMRDEYEGRS